MVIITENCGVYILTFRSTKKKYVGVSRDIKQRFYFYKKLFCKDQVQLYRALKKYGWDDVRVDVFPCDEDHLIVAEKVLIRKLDTFKNGYNMTEGGEYVADKRVSEETKRRHSEFMKKKHKEFPITDEHKEKIRESNRNRTCGKETREKMSSSQNKRFENERKMGIGICSEAQRIKRKEGYKRNYDKLIAAGKAGSDRICPRCNERKVHTSSTGKTRSYCKECLSDKRKLLKLKNKQKRLTSEQKV